MVVLDIQHLSVEIPTEDGVIYAVQDVSFSVEAGSFFGIVGESGSGKSVLAQAILGLVPNARITGRALFDGRDLLRMSRSELQAVRGSSISMIFQDPLSSLHPQYTIGWQITEQIHAHTRVSTEAARDRAIELLSKVGISEPARRFDAYPHQFSGGMRQRVMIAMALSLNPRLVIADEPTTALDSTVQVQILSLLREMRDAFDATIVMISHDLLVLGRVADAMMVMYAGQNLETGPATELFTNPAHPYAAGLVRSSPSVHGPGAALVPIAGKPPSMLRRVAGCVFAERCPDAMDVCSRERPPIRTYDSGLRSRCWLERPPSNPPERTSSTMQTSAAPDGRTAGTSAPLIEGRGLELSFRDRRGRNDLRVLRGIDLFIQRGETLGLVGESGCGKSTLARVLAGLIPPDRGGVLVEGRPLSSFGREEWRQFRRKVQLVFQDPYGALNPRRRVGSIIGDPFRIHGTCSGETRKRRVQELMELVGLNPEHYNRFPAQFSGGQRQRIGIARALALNPSLVICDEPVSALDVSIQAQVLNLMTDLQKALNLSYLFISHDLAVVRHMSDRIAVMDQGRIIELATAEDLYAHPQQELTRKLLEASSPTIRRSSGTKRRLVATISAAV